MRRVTILEPVQGSGHKGYNWTMETTSKKFLVLGYTNTGSGSLTFPEDFSFVGVHDAQEDAQEVVDRLNRETLVDHGYEEDEEFPHTSDELQTILDDPNDEQYEGVMVHTVYAVNYVPKHTK